LPRQSITLSIPDWRKRMAKKSETKACINHKEKWGESGSGMARPRF
jgi:hypothetical protein